MNVRKAKKKIRPQKKKKKKEKITQYFGSNTNAPIPY